MCCLRKPRRVHLALAPMVLSLAIGVATLGIVRADHGSGILIGFMGQAEPSDLAERATATQKKIADAYVKGDADAAATLYTPDAIVMPFEGGALEGIDAIREHCRRAPRPDALEIRSERIEQLGDFVLDIGRISGRLPEAAGGRSIEAEYVVLARIGADGALKVHRVIWFSPRGHRRND